MQSWDADLETDIEVEKDVVVVHSVVRCLLVDVRCGIRHHCKTRLGKHRHPFMNAETGLKATRCSDIILSEHLIVAVILPHASHFRTEKQRESEQRFNVIGHAL